MMRRIPFAAFLVSAAVALPAQATSDPQVERILARLDINQFKSNIEELSQWENRVVDSDGNRAAIDWLEAKLESFGYEVTRHKFTPQPRRRRTGGNRGGRGGGRGGNRGAGGQRRAGGGQRGQRRGGQRGGGEPVVLENVWATKIGSTNPDRMYIVSAHMDSVRRAPGANDDASGCSLVLEAARVFAAADVQTDVSVRFILWNAEETGLNGAKAYVQDRGELQGVEEPAGSGRYPEPRWLGVVQHDQILFDHGLPAEDEQSPRADIDIEYQQQSDARVGSMQLAADLLVANALYAKDYPAEVTSDMSNTDSGPFQDFCPAISVRENIRRLEMPNGAAPHWHQATDRYDTYSEKDFLFGFNTVQTTLGAIATLAGLRFDN